MKDPYYFVLSVGNLLNNMKSFPEGWVHRAGMVGVLDVLAQRIGSNCVVYIIWKQGNTVGGGFLKNMISGKNLPEPLITTTQGVEENPNVPDIQEALKKFMEFLANQEVPDLFPKPQTKAPDKDSNNAQGGKPKKGKRWENQ